MSSNQVKQPGVRSTIWLLVRAWQANPRHKLVQHIGAVLIWTLAVIMAIVVVRNYTNIVIIVCRRCPEIAKGCGFPLLMLE